MVAIVVQSKKDRTGQSSGVLKNLCFFVTISLIAQTPKNTKPKSRIQAVLVPENTIPNRRSKIVGIIKITIKISISIARSKTFDEFHLIFVILSCFQSLQIGVNHHFDQLLKTCFRFPAQLLLRFPIIALQ